MSQDQEAIKLKLKELRQRYPATSFQYIWQKAFEELGDSESYHEHLSQAESNVIHKPITVIGGWLVEL